MNFSFIKHFIEFLGGSRDNSSFSRTAMSVHKLYFESPLSLLLELLFRVQHWFKLLLHEPYYTPYNVGSVLWRLFSTLEVVQYIGGITSVQWGIASVLWGIASVLWRLFSAVGDNISICRG